MSGAETSRPYSSPRRDAAARATRRAVLDAAHRLFVERGYVGATIDEIAREAEVSRPTVFSVGSKADLLRHVRDVAIAGDDEPVSVPDRPEHQEVRDAPDAATALRLHARNVVAIGVRYVEIDEVLRQAASSDPDLHRLWEASEEQRHAGAAMVVDAVLAKGELRPGLGRREATDVLWLLMAPDHLRRLRKRGWSDAAYETWLADTMIRALLP